MRYLVPHQIYPMRASRPVAGGHTLVVSALVGFRLEEPGVFLEDQALWAIIQARAGQDGVFDLWQPKHGAEFLVWGSAQAPTPVAHMEVSVQCGPLRKRLRVSGDRHWVPGLMGWSASEPQAFTEMPIVWERSFGGPGVPAFPQGVGADAMALIEAGQPAPLPNISLPHAPVLHPEDAGVSAGFMPMPRVAEVPATSGTFDRRWLARQFPVMPDDFDPAFFNLAPRDQRIPGVWQGGETVLIEGMNASRPRLACTVPSVRMRCFFTRRTDGELLEQAMRMDTIGFFPGDGCGALVFRAEIENAGHHGKAISELMLGLEDLAEPRPFDHYQRVHRSGTDPATHRTGPLPDHELMPLGSKTQDAPAPAGSSELDLQRAAAERAAERLRGASAALGSVAMASVLADAPVSPAPQAATSQADESPLAAPTPAQPDAASELDRLSEDMLQLAERLASQPEKGVDAIVGEWAATLDPKGEALEGLDWMDSPLPAQLTSDPAVRQQMARAIRDATAGLQDAMSSGEDGAQDVAKIQARIAQAWASGAHLLSGSNTLMPDLPAAAQAAGLPALAQQLQELEDLMKTSDGGAPTALDDTKLQQTLQSIFSTQLAASEDLRQDQAGAVELKDLLPEGALTPDNIKGLITHWSGGARDDGNPLVQAMLQGHGQPSEALTEQLRATIGADLMQRSDLLDDMLEKVSAGSLQDLGRHRQFALEELMQMLGSDEATEPIGAEPPAPADVDEAALEASLRATEGEAETAAEAPDEPTQTAADTESADLETKVVAADLAQARRDSRGQPFRPVDLSDAAAAALGQAVLREHAQGRSFRDRDLAGADLRGADLRGADLSGALLEGADLTGARLTGARCADAVFIGARLDGADCSHADFSAANLGQVRADSSLWLSANLGDAVLAQAHLKGACMAGARLDGCDAEDACLREVDLSGSSCEKGRLNRVDLSGASLESVAWTRVFLVGAVLDRTRARQATLKDCVLTDARGEGTCLAQANLASCKLLGVSLPRLDAPGLHAPDSTWYSSQLPGAVFDCADLSRAHFVEADLGQASLRRCQLKDALLTHADLQRASLAGSQLCGASLQGANATAAGLQQANLFGADLDGAELDRCDLSGATLDRTLLSLPAHD